MGVIQFKRGKEEALSRVNPILAMGEPGFVIDKNSVKIGDGITAWNDLPYLGIVSADPEQFIIDASGNLILRDIDMNKVIGLVDAFAGKVDKVDGSRLLTADEAVKLEKLVIGDNGEIAVSGKVSAGNVDGLDIWITNRAGTLKGLSENNLTNSLIEKINSAEVNLIDIVQVNGVALDITSKTVNIRTTDVVKASDEVTVSTDGILGIGTISTDKIVQGEQTLILNGGSATA
jgi:hypothetical protein